MFGLNGNALGEELDTAGSRMASILPDSREHTCEQPIDAN